MESLQPHQAYAHHAAGTTKLQLAKPFPYKKCRHVVKRTNQLMHRRNVLDRELLLEVEKLRQGSDDWPLRERLLREQDDLETRERRHLRKTSKRFAEIEILYMQNPTIEHARTYDLIRKLLWRFKRSLGPLLEIYHQREGGCEDEKLDSPRSSASITSHNVSQNIADCFISNDTTTSQANGKKGEKRRWVEDLNDASSKKLKPDPFAEEDHRVRKKERGKDDRKANQRKDKSNQADRTNDN
ncbi:hypothetical protein F4810DRAFT_217253 [Camillea tinctor]|nr:hypothetical protein F4810DRAFT_217253 [Camillea tinctor]